MARIVTIAGLKKEADAAMPDVAGGTKISLRGVSILSCKVVEAKQVRKLSNGQLTRSFTVDDGTGSVDLNLYGPMVDDLEEGWIIRIWTAMFYRNVHADGLFDNLSLGTFEPRKKISILKKPDKEVKEVPL